MGAAEPLSLYFHIPFCTGRCPYCDFYSTTDTDLRDGYAQALLRALKTAPQRGRPAATVYFGGGTPSLMEDRVGPLLDAADRAFPFAPDVEITLEANPCSVTPALLRAWREAGVNRLSVGLQALDDGTLRLLGRRHTAAQGFAAVYAAADAGFENLSADLMLALPGQTEGEAAAAAERAADLPLRHISAYLLKIEPDTPFGRQGIEARCPDPDAAADCYLAFSAALETRGFVHYEISNFARPGCESRHNLVYWRLGDYLGLGPSAHSFCGGRRFFFPASLPDFLAAEAPWALCEDEGEGGTAEEYLMLSLRLAEGLSLDEWRRRGGSPETLLQKAAPMQRAGLLRRERGCLSLTGAGFLVSNAVIGRLLG